MILLQATKHVSKQKQAKVHIDSFSLKVFLFKLILLLIHTMKQVFK